MTLLFLTVCGAAAIIAWIIDLPNRTDLEAGADDLVVKITDAQRSGSWS